MLVERFPPYYIALLRWPHSAESVMQRSGVRQSVFLSVGIFIVTHQGSMRRGQRAFRPDNKDLHACIKWHCTHYRRIDKYRIIDQPSPYIATDVRQCVFSVLRNHHYCITSNECI